MSNLNFEVIKKDENSKARNGILTLPHGKVLTPTFMPVGTNATVKAIYHDKLKEIGYNLILANTYHLYLRPGMEVMKDFGGIHSFSSWDGNVLTDSGGFQVFSLSALRKIDEKGVSFQSHIDGSRHIFTPEKVIQTEHIIGSDIAMCLDVCTPPKIDYRAAKEAMRITHFWARRSLEELSRIDDFRGNVFGIVQGNFYEDLRKESALTISEMDFPGIAIGGLSVGEEKSVFRDFLAHTASYVTLSKPRYVMGIGSPDYIFEAVENGIDLFDCVLATRMARNGTAFSDDGPVVLKKAIHKFDHGPLDENCNCSACRKYSRAYLHHLVKCNEMLGGMLITEHNLTYLFNLMTRIRESIDKGNFLEFKRSYIERYYGK